MKTVLVTGASRGIGRSIAMKFASEGYNVVMNYEKNEQAARKTKNDVEAFGVGALLIKADVSDDTKVEQMIRDARIYFGNIDIVINNAGIAYRKLFQDVTSEEWHRIFDVNVNGVYNVCKHTIPKMIENKAGVILNIASIWGIVGGSMETHYSATKGAVIALSKALAKELAPSNIRVNVVAPGAVDTDMLKALTGEEKQSLGDVIPLGEIGEPDDIATLVYYLATDDSKYITGQVISPNGGMVI